jgi:hypothetical protein
MNIDKVKRILKEYVILEKMKDEFDVELAKREDVEVFIKRHYLQKFPTGIKKIYAIHKKETEGKKMVGMIIYGTPFPTVVKFLEPEVKLNEMLELKRLYIDDIGVRNLESFVIGQTLNLLRKEEPNLKVVVTFADDNQGHVGGIYQATNGIYLGKSESGKHKYIYILGGDVKAIKNKIQSMIQAYPKKDTPPITESINDDLLKQIKAELEKDKKSIPAMYASMYDDEFDTTKTKSIGRKTSKEKPPIAGHNTPENWRELGDIDMSRAKEKEKLKQAKIRAGQYDPNDTSLWTDEEWERWEKENPKLPKLLFPTPTNYAADALAKRKAHGINSNDEDNIGRTPWPNITLKHNTWKSRPSRKAKVSPKFPGEDKPQISID